jgi:hypothetical protein
MKTRVSKSRPDIELRDPMLNRQHAERHNFRTFKLHKSVLTQVATMPNATLAHSQIK